MLPDTLAQAEQILDYTNEYLSTLEDKKEFSLVFCPPFVFTEEVGKILNTSHLEREASLGAQDISTQDSGAMTGEVSGPMLRKLGVRYVVVGHSERRWKLGESDEVVNMKLKAALRNEIIPIVCIGERVRDGNFAEFLQKQIEATFKDLTQDEVGKCIIAYEPVWAISSNPGSKPDTPESAVESVTLIKDFLFKNYELRAANYYLYGGSVNSKNISSFIKCKEIDGVLVGSASVNKEEFVRLLKNVGV